MDKRVRVGDDFQSTEVNEEEKVESDAMVQATLRRFRDTAARIRAQIKQDGVSVQPLLPLHEPEVGLPSGLAVLRGALSFKEQLTLARQCLEEFAFYPHNNLSALGQTLPREAHVRKVRWACLGMNYDWTNRKYVENWRSEFPADLSLLCTDLARKGGYGGEFTPEAAIVNFYTRSQIMGPHRDDAELTMEKPIVSISLGCDAVFCIETRPFHANSQVAAVRLRSGDVVVMAGESRQALHGVAVTIPDTFESKIANGEEVTLEERQLIKLLGQERININVRQVEDLTKAECTFQRGAGHPHTGLMSCAEVATEPSQVHSPAS